MARLDRIQSDLRIVRLLGRVIPGGARHRQGRPHTVVDEFDKVIAAHAHEVAVIDADDDGREVTFGELGEQSHRVARWALAQGIGRGEVVALLMHNRPEYLSTWLGLARVGAITALINTNLTGEPLRHSIAVSGADHLILDRDLAANWTGARPDDSTITEWLRFDGDALGGGRDLDAALDAVSPAPVDRAVRRGMTTRDPLFFIYTSGTTGLPKAARFSHGRFLTVAVGLQALVGVRSDDRMYVTLPLYHTAGGVMAVGGSLLAGASVITTRRFSASRFWDHCVDHGATMFQYIGELCRYLVNSPSHPRERDHALRVCVGNGLRPDVWPTFRDRFAIPHIVEFYGATEGTASLFNLDDKVGAIGRLRPGVARRLGIHLVGYDVAADEIRRDAEGHVIPVAIGEPGEAITRITGLVPFEGYSDDEATERKILRNAFRDGDTYFRTGDLMRTDAEGYYYFVDRIGDTFRWKAENVSTAEVAAVVGGTPGVLEANVYGVEVKGQDGRAGMASVVVDDTFDLETFLQHVAANLAGYARPLFVRRLAEVEITATFKHRKREAVEEGFDPAVIGDDLWFLDAAQGCYVPLTPELHGRIVAGELRL